VKVKVADKGTLPTDVIFESVISKYIPLPEYEAAIIKSNKR
jgi:hypothetical protein